MNYEVNSNTLAIIPSSSGKCKVLEDKKSYNLNKTSLRVIEHSCEYFGVSFASRVEGSKRFVKTRYKTPIVIEESSRIVFFPVKSLRGKDTMWISYNNIIEYYPSHVKKGYTVVRFKNGYKLEIDVSFYSFNNQYLKAARLSSAVADRVYRNY